MGICCSCCVARKLKPVVPTLLLPAPTTEQMQDPLAEAPSTEQMQDPSAEDPDDADHDSSTIHLYLNDGETAFLKTNATGNSFFTMVSVNFTSWISQASGAIKAIWDDGDEDNEEETRLDADTSSKLIIFSLAELKAATSGFRRDMLLGIGGFGKVYKGTQKKTIRGTDEKFFAVKQLDFNSKQGYRQWQTEVKFLRKLSHPNIIKLLGYCQDDDDEELLIVYEFMRKGSLNYHLFGKRAGRSLPWDIRLKVVIGMARGLCYLHTMERPIIFRDFKSSNILLDENNNAKISDFGLAKWGPEPGNSCIKGHVMGTDGYADPEYVATGNLYLKSDVYGFGVVLAEILTGLRAVDKNRPTEKRILADWVKPYLSNKTLLKQIMDFRLEGKYAPKEATVMAQLAFRCLNQTPELRPSMKEVVDSLEQLQVRYQ